MLPPYAPFGDGLGHDVQGLAGHELQVRHHERLQPGPELGCWSPDPLGHGPDLAVVLGQQGDDAVRLPQLVGAQHDGVITVGARCKGR